jgi:two-component sensor histidine kinase
LISEAEAAASTTTEEDFARSGRDWDTQAEENVGDFFQQGRALIQDGVDTGFITSKQADELATVLGRLEAEQQRAMTTEWAAGELRKALPAAPPTARAARQAVSLVAADIPPAALETAQLLTSELVTNSIKHSLPSPARIGLCVEIDRDRVRIEVSHSSDAPSEQQPPKGIDGYGVKLVESLASRWDTTRDGETTTIWFELDLPFPGTQV